MGWHRIWHTRIGSWPVDLVSVTGWSAVAVWWALHNRTWFKGKPLGANLQLYVVSLGHVLGFRIVFVLLGSLLQTFGKKPSWSASPTSSSFRKWLWGGRGGRRQILCDTHVGNPGCHWQIKVLSGFPIDMTNMTFLENPPWMSRCVISYWKKTIILEAMLVSFQGCLAWDSRSIPSSQSQSTNTMFTMHLASHIIAAWIVDLANTNYSPKFNWYFMYFFLLPLSTCLPTVDSHANEFFKWQNEPYAKIGWYELTTIVWVAGNPN